MSPSYPSTERLIALVQSLPQELIDAIQAYTFTASKKQIEISAGYTPPALLSVNSSTRRSYARDFYCETIFHSRNEDLLARWIISLPVSHRETLKRVRFIRHMKAKGEKAESSLTDEKKTFATIREQIALRLSMGGVEVEDLKYFTVWIDER